MSGALEESLVQVGLFGRAQFLMIFASVVTQIYIGWPSVIAVFVAIDVPFQCVNSSDLINGTLPVITDFDSKCRDGCPHYVYDSSPSSLVSEYDLACGDGPTLVSTANSVFWVGFLISCFISGSLADAFGRRTVSLISCALYTGTSLLLPTTRNIYEFIAIRFVCGVFHYPLTSIVYILVGEWVDKEKFAKVGMTTMVSFGLGESLCALVCYIFRESWRNQLVVMALALFLVLALIYWFVPESAKWLYQTGNTKSCDKVLKTVAKRNRKKIENSYVHSEDASQPKRDGSDVEAEAPADESSDSLDNDVVETLLPVNSNESSDSTKSGPAKMSDLFATKKALLLMITNISCWFSSCLVYFGLAFGVSSLSGNIYVNSTLLALVEIPAWFVVLAMDYFGRRSTLVFCLLWSSIACGLIPLTNDLCPSLSIVLALIGKLLATGSFDLLFIFTAEQLPTVLRTTGLSMCSAAARIATISAPYIIQGGDISEYIPYEFFALTGVVSFGLSLFFQVETLDKPMPQSLQQYYTLVDGAHPVLIEEEKEL